MLRYPSLACFWCPGTVSFNTDLHFISLLLALCARPPRLDNCKFTKLWDESLVLYEVTQPMLPLYCFEIPFREQSPAVLDELDEVEKLLGFINWPWWNNAERAYMISHKVTVMECRLLFYFGSLSLYNGTKSLLINVYSYRQFATTTYGKPWRSFPTKEWQLTLSLPTWLTTPHLYMCKFKTSLSSKKDVGTL